jgi:hypothetical protein
LSVFTARRNTDLIYNLSDGTNPTKTISGDEYGVSFEYTPWIQLPISAGLMSLYYSLDASSISQALAENELKTQVQYFDVQVSGKNTALLSGPQITIWYPSAYFQPYIRVAQLYGEEITRLSSEYKNLQIVTPGGSVISSRTDTFDTSRQMVSLGVRLSPIRILRLNHDHRFPLIALDSQVYAFGLFAEYGMESGIRSFTATSRSRSATTSGTNTESTTNKIGTKEVVNQELKSTTLRFGIQYTF